MDIEDIKQEIRSIGAIAFLKKVSQSLEDLGVGEVEPLSAHLAIEVEEVIFYNQPSIVETVHELMFG